ncbi:phage tail sheath family protein [Bacillaceae bacterium IKA-2]|nr:phage tail sheath family protein [Bacillaceae bacterium IKA-2]
MYQHGISVQENPTSIIPPITSNSGVQVIVGTAPVNMATNPAVNKPVIAYSWGGAVEQLGYSDDWDDYNLSEVMDASFKRIGVAPLIFINVLDPAVHKTDVSGEVIALQNGEGKIDAFGILLPSIVIKSGDGLTTYEKDADYSVDFNKDGYPIVTVIDGGTITTGTTELQADFTKIDPTMVTKSDIIGGYDAVNNKYSGLELVGQVYPRLGIVPGLILSPSWSQDPEVASVIDVKSEQINGTFNCMNVLDADSSLATKYQDVPQWKNDNAYTSKRSIVCWPKVKIGDRVYWYSSIMAALTAYTDAQNDNVPYVSPSNKRLPITGAVLSDGATEVFLDQRQANFLNGAGIVTAINVNGWKSWGNNTAAYPSTTDPKDRFIAIRRVFDWWGNTFIQTYSEKVDDPTNFRLIESIIDSENIRGNGFQARGMIAGAKIEFRQEDNPITDILNGRIQFIQRIGAFPPAENIVNVLEFDPTMLENSLFGGE